MANMTVCNRQTNKQPVYESSPQIIFKAKCTKGLAGKTAKSQV